MRITRHFETGDIALLKNDSICNYWSMCKIMEMYPDERGIVESVKVLLWGSGDNNNEWILVQPITKSVLLVEAKNVYYQ